MPATGWTQHDAAMTVARAQHIPLRGSIDEPGRYELLDMLGLLDATGQIAHDPVSTTEIVLEHPNRAATPLEPAKGRMAQRHEPPSPGGKFCPPGLRALFEGKPPEPAPTPPVAATSKPKPAPKPKTAKPGVGRGNGRPLQPIKHGQPNGAAMHRRRGEEVCDACREGRRVYDRECKRRNYVPKPRKVSQCGTPAGRERHRRKKELICDECKAAHNEGKRERRGSRAA